MRSALVPCPTCRRQVSDLARTCPGCGGPLVSGALVAREVTRFRVSAAVIAAVGLGLLAMSMPGPAPNPADPIAMAAAQGFAPARAMERAIAFVIAAAGAVIFLAAGPLARLKLGRGGR